MSALVKGKDKNVYNRLTWTAVINLLGEGLN